MIASSVSTFAKRSSGLLRPSTTNRFLLQPLSATTQHHQHCRFVHIEKKLEELGIELPPPSGPKANYNIICFARNNTLYMSGHLPIKADGSMVTGKIGGEGGKSVDHGYEAARTIGLGLISSMKEHLGDLDRVEQIVKILGVVNSDDSFTEQHLVMNGCSDLLVEVFDKPKGYHARSAIGVNTLPLGVSVEIEAIVEFKPE